MLTTSIRLLERLRQPNDPAAWERFVALYAPLLYRWAGSLGLQSADAADLVQDVFVQLLRALPTFTYDPNRRFRHWLHTLLLNRWRDRRPVLVLPVADLPAADPDPAEVLAEADYHRFLVTRALQLMQTDFEPATWKACWQCVVEGRTPAEVAEELGLSVAAVYVAKSRVLRRLRQELEGMLE